MRILIAAGGTGGHVYPALAVCRSLRERVPDVEFRWIGGHRGLESTIVPAEGHPLELLPLRSLRTVDLLSHHTVTDPARLGASYPVSVTKMMSARPDAVFTTGGYVAVPVVAAAATLRVPSVMWEGNLIPGRSVRATARLATALAVSFGETCKRLPGRCYVTGTPIRALTGDRHAARAALKLEADTPVVLVFGGSQAVRRLNRAVSDALPRLVERISIVHLTGQPAYADALKRRQALPPERQGRYRPFPFLRNEMADALIASDLLVGRAGSSTLAEASALGLPMVVVPYPHASAHQIANARALAAAGAARIVADESFDADALVDACELLHDPEALASMRVAAAGFGRPGAAAAVAELVLALAERNPLPAASTIERMSRAAA